MLVRSGKASALLLESVVVECLYILTKHYHVPRSEVAASLSGILLYKGITNPDRDALVNALSLFGGGTLDPVDCVLAAKSAADGLTLLTFDKVRAKYRLLTIQAAEAGVSLNRLASAKLSH